MKGNSPKKNLIKSVWEYIKKPNAYNKDVYLKKMKLKKKKNETIVKREDRIQKVYATYIIGKNLASSIYKSNFKNSKNVQKS